MRRTIGRKHSTFTTGSCRSGANRDSSCCPWRNLLPEPDPLTDWILHKLADRLGVAPARAGESTSPHIRFEQSWPQWLLVLTVVGSIVFIVWLYRREGRASAGSKIVLAGLRIILVLLAVFMLSEAVLSVQRTGLPY